MLVRERALMRKRTALAASPPPPAAQRMPQSHWRATGRDAGLHRAARPTPTVTGRSRRPLSPGSLTAL
eukprot:10344176-Lingulodinium_polyedra.AAC.1